MVLPPAPIPEVEPPKVTDVPDLATLIEPLAEHKVEVIVAVELSVPSQSLHSIVVVCVVPEGAYSEDEER